MRFLKILDTYRLGLLVFFGKVAVFSTLRDPDYYWHLKTGEIILAEGRLPKTDPFSFTRPGSPWVLHEWLFQVILYLVHRAGGPWAVRALMAGLAAAAVVFAGRTARLFLPSKNAVLLVSLPFMVYLAVGVSPRPQLVTYVFLSFLIYALFQEKYAGKPRLLGLVPLLMVAWVNAHAGYMMGIVLLWLFAVCEAVRLRLHGPVPHGDRGRLYRLAMVAAAAAAASTINPYFIEHWLYPFQVSAMWASTHFISEWQSPNFHGLLDKGYLGLIALWVVFLVFNRQKPDVTELAVPAVVVLLSFQAVRHMPLVALVLISHCALSLSRGFDDAWPLRPLQAAWQRYKQGKGRGSRELGDLEYVFNWILLGVAGVAAYGLYPTWAAGEPLRLNSLLPVDAVEFVEREGVRGRVFNTYHFGGYLIFKFYPDQKVFVDGRADMYGDEFLKEYDVMYRGKPGWEDAFDPYGIDYVVCERNAPIRQLLIARGDFRLVYDDESNSVLVKDVPKFRSLILRHEIKPIHAP
ncbi:MAG: hypothetical protein WHS86_06060 [Desulfosoma sp.]